MEQVTFNTSFRTQGSSLTLMGTHQTKYALMSKVIP